MQNNKKLSVALATFNEEANLASCLGSVKALSPEIVIADESSTDKTTEIAAKFGAKVIKTHHEPIFHKTKNKAILVCNGDWILQLDADESLTPELVREIKDLLAGTYFGYDSWLSPTKTSINRVLPVFKKPAKLSSPAAAYFLPRKNFFLSRYLMNAGQYPDPVIRLFQRGLARLPAKDVHEQFEVDGQVAWLRGDLDHNSTPNFSRYLKRENAYSSLYAEELKKAKVAITLWNTISYLFLRPALTFFRLFIRYRGFLDGFPGFVFSLYSGFHHAFAYMKLWELYQIEKHGHH